MSEPKGRCKKMVVDRNSRMWRQVQCSRNATKDGFCGIHQPSAEAQRRAIVDARWRAERDLLVKQRTISQAERRVIDAAGAWRDKPWTDDDVEVSMLADAIDALRKAKKE